MNCPKCGSGETSIIDSRNRPDNTRRRRYLCSKCKFRFSTNEATETKRRITVNRTNRPNCPNCQSGQTDYIESHIRPDGTRYRRCVCSDCSYPFSIVEIDLEKYRALIREVSIARRYINEL